MPSKLTITSSIFLAPEKMAQFNLPPALQDTWNTSLTAKSLKGMKKGLLKYKHSQNQSLPFRKGTMMSTIKYHWSLCTVTMLSQRGRMKAALMRRVERHPSCSSCSLVVVDKLEPHTVGKYLLCYSVSGVVCMEAGGWQDYGPIIIHERCDIVLYFKQNILSSSNNK